VIDWEVGLPDGGSMFLNFVIIGSIFGVMGISMGSYLIYTSFFQKNPEYTSIQS
jgi:hypothetical protein